MEGEKKKIRSFTELKAWQEGHRLVLMIYKTTKNFPKEEMFGLISQMRRCVLSITSNIAEGFSRGTVRDKVHFYCKAHGSLTELQNQLIVAGDVNYITKEEFNVLANQTILIHKLIAGLKKIKNT